MFAATSFAANSAMAAYPEKTTLTPDAAFARLKEGNAKFIKDGSCVPTGGAARAAELASGQAPFAVVVTCSDSRTPPEHVFSAGLGELFIIRVAGNTVDATALGSIEYGVKVLGATLVLVMGHSRCGAVDAAIGMVRDGTDYPGSINEVVAPILPAVLKAQKAGGDWLTQAIRINVEDVLRHTEESSTILSDAKKAGKLRMVGGVYELSTGEVAFMA